MKNSIFLFIAMIMFSTVAISQNYSDYPFIKIQTMFSEQPVVVNKETDQMKKTDIGDKFIKILTSDHQPVEQNVNINLVVPNSNLYNPVQQRALNNQQMMYLRRLDLLCR